MLIADYYWELILEVTVEFTTPQILVAHDLIQLITVNGLRHAGGPVLPHPLHLLSTAYLFVITSPRLTREQIENRL